MRALRLCVLRALYARVPCRRSDALLRTHRVLCARAGVRVRFVHGAMRRYRRIRSSVVHFCVRL